MAKLSGEVVALWLEQDCTNQEFLRVRVVVHETISQRIPKYSSEYVAELSESIEADVIYHLEVRANEYNRDGVSPSFEIEGEAPDVYFKVRQSPEKDLLTLLRAMTPVGFEVFCGAILKQLSGQIVVEGKPYDGGVDFYAFDLAPGGERGPAPYASRIWIIGQSKRYKQRNDITEKDLREFVGGALGKLDQLRERHPERYGILTPVLFAYWTTSDFDRHAKRYARHMGLWYLNGVGLAQLAIRVGLRAEDVALSEANAVRKGPQS